jgi:voltage-gated potassium channel
MLRRRPVLQRFLSNPSSFRYAAAALISATAATVLVGAVVIRVFDPTSFPTFGDSLWFTLQTATTVGYGDQIPDSGLGRLVAAIVMLISVGIVAVATAAVASLFVQSAAAARRGDADSEAADAIARLEASIAAMREQLDRIEHRAGVGDPPSASR